MESTLPSMLTVITSTLVRLIMLVDPTEWVGRFQSLRVVRSRLSTEGPYEPVTDSVWSNAWLVNDANQTAPNLALNGTDLTLLVNHTQTVHVTFVGTDPISIASAATQITDAAPHLLYATQGAEARSLTVRTNLPGNGSSIEVTGGSAVPVLGLAFGQSACGADHDLPLVTGQTRYEVADANGSGDFWYRYCLVDRTTGLQSPYSVPMRAGNHATVLPPERMVRGFLRLADAQGKPWAQRNVHVYYPTQYVEIENHNIVGGDTLLTTDATGYVGIDLVRGTIMRVSVPSTGLIREVTAPVDPAVQMFNMFDPAYGQDDCFRVQTSDQSFLVRSSL